MFALFTIAYLHSYAIARDPYWNLYCDRDGSGWAELDYDDSTPEVERVDTRWPVNDPRCRDLARD